MIRKGARQTERMRRRAMVLAGFVLLGQLASILHFALVHHTICPLDGEVVDAHPGERHALSDRPDPSAAPSNSSEHEHGHEHCVFAWFHRNLPAWVPAAPAVTPVVQQGTTTAPDQAHRPQLALHRLAPKQSPPA